MRKINREEHGKKGAFFIEENGEWLAEMTYVRAGESKIIIDHTEVDDSLKGNGVGKDLVAEGVKFARENNLKIVATCTFAKAELEKHPEYADVLAG